LRRKTEVLVWDDFRPWLIERHDRLVTPRHGWTGVTVSTRRRES
jgi:hypothetical protein